MEEEVTVRERLEGVVEAAGERSRFEILAITAGEGNGWLFGEQALRESLPLWDGAQTFIDHSLSLPGGRSLRDLAGVCSRPRYDEQARGVRMVLSPAGPSAALMETLAREWLSSRPPRPRIGFSADLVFTARGREVQKIVRVHSLDLVVNPARGGSFIHALPDAQRDHNPMQCQGEAMMSEMQQPQEHAQADELETLRLSLCASLLETRLASAGLPESARQVLRRRFEGRAFHAGDLDGAIDDARQLVAGAQAPGLVSGPRVSGMTTGEDRLQLAVDDLLAIPRDAASAATRVERLGGIRELYTLMTGDYELHGGFHPERVSLATSATMAGLVTNSLNKAVLYQWDQLGAAGYRWWEKLVHVEHFNSLHEITGVLVGEVGLLPGVSEGDAYEPLNIEDSPETGTWTKYGGYLPLTLELIDRDDLSRLRAYPRKLANASLRRISALVASVFTTAGGAGPLMADNQRVFDATNHLNLGTAALSAESWEAASAAIYDQPMLVYEGDTAPNLALNARYLLVPRALRLAAMQILYPELERTATYVTQNLQKGEWGDVVTVPEWTDAGDWAAMADPRLAPGIIIGERFGLRPEIFIAGDEHSPAMFTNDEVRIKVRHFLSVFVADYRPLYKANVA